MKLFSRLFLSHLLVIMVAVGALLIVTELLASALVRHHVEQMAALIGPTGASLRPDLELGMRNTLTSALLASVPLSLTVAALTALFSARQVMRSVVLLRDGSHAIAAGEYTLRLPEEGQDELTDLARHFNRMGRALEQVERGRVDLITNVAHELRTPLGALRGYAEALEDQVMAPATASQAILREMRALERLARDLSLVSKVEAGAVELRLSTFEPKEVLLTARTRFEGAAEEFGLRLALELSSPLPPVTGDVERTSQILANLLSNALRHTPSGGQVTLSARQQGAAVRFEVRDTGPGIAPEHLSCVFERFYRANAARTRGEGEGSGVGLTIARGLAERMGGTLTATSSSAGSVFAFTLLVAHPAT
ncbi:sensor histidine kinase [Deinococcus marmoris]|uniref:histidine kinase n=1 Tax=Deinococcus marmoris TaxID=249408 RepID=A0A1U7NWG0_9DEIO|nr:ATP-binding protein [Deinococcus marmoris]OLV17268.1 sensor histidine kinase [Deinococcus marmoris]OLV18671.1 sensor histidine kinase [Deinococcus marmoris]